MISGEYRHTIDAKSRTFLPSKLREKLGDEIVISKSTDKCLTVYSAESWKVFEAKIEALPPIKAKEVKRWVYAFSNETIIDQQGRVSIPQNLRDYAELSKNIVSIGMGDHIEIWSEENYSAMADSLNAESIESTLIEMGM